MTLNLKRCISILLVLMLFIGIVPHAYAAEESETVAAAMEPPNNATLSATNDYAVMSAASTQNSIMTPNLVAVYKA